MAIRMKRDLSKEEKEEQRRAKAERERARAQWAFSTILSTMSEIVREEVCHLSIELWRDKLNNIFRERGRTIKLEDFLINAREVDPFNADAPINRALAEWFVEQWHRFKPGASTVHVRGLHYAISALAKTPDAVYLPNGKIYDNTDVRWEDLQRAGKYARYLNLIDPEVFEDRRSRTPIVYPFETNYRSLAVSGEMYEFSSFGLPSFSPFLPFPDLPEFPSMPRYLFSLQSQQRYRLEVWIEKSTQENAIRPVCDKHRITLVTAQGEISISSMWEAVKRAERYGDQTTTVILYISDFDPAGKSMPVAASRKIEFLSLIRRSKINMRLYPIALTYEQCVRYQLPRTPIKESERRRQGFEGRYGVGATELDALESLYPGELAKLLEQTIRRFRDDSIKKRELDRWSEIRDELNILQREVQNRHGMDTLKEEYDKAESALLEIAEAHDEYENAYNHFEAQYDRDVRAKFNVWHSDYFKPLRANLQSAIQAVESDLEEEMPDVEKYEIPEAAEVPLDDDCLYGTTREYVPQLSVYKQFAGKFAHLIEDEDGDDVAS